MPSDVTEIHLRRRIRELEERAAELEQHLRACIDRSGSPEDQYYRRRDAKSYLDSIAGPKGETQKRDAMAESIAAQIEGGGHGRND